MARNTFDVDEKLETPFNAKHLKRSFIYVVRYKKQMLLALFITITGSLIGLLAPLIMQQAVDVAVPQKNTLYLIQLSVLLLLSIAINIIFSTIRGRITTRVGQNIIYDIRQDLFIHLQYLPFSYYDSRPHGKILVRVVQYVNSVSDMLSNGLINVIIELCNVFLITGFMFMVNAQLALIVLAGLPFFVCVIFYIKPKTRKAWQEQSNKSANLNSYMAESMDGVKVTQLFNRQEENQHIADTLIQVFHKAWMRAIFWVNTVWFSSETIAQVVFSCVYIGGVFWVYPAVSFGVLLAMGNYVSRFWQPITNLANLYNSFVNNIAYLERIFETIDEPIEIFDSPNAVDMPPIRGHVVFTNVCFAYEHNCHILKNVSLDIHPGQSIALVGPTGAGKTTIVNLISRFYNVTEGTIAIDNFNIADVTLHSLRSQMGIMLQDSFLFSGTILENIRYGCLNATDSECIEAAKIVCADEFIKKLPQGYNTEVKERGSSVSQGQRQLISFARTLVANPRILILDEATSSIDTQTEVLLQRAIQNLLKKRTSFIIAHRLSTIRTCNRILYIDNGQITESGSHDELMRMKGKYYSLVMSQQKEVHAEEYTT